MACYDAYNENKQAWKITLVNSHNYSCEPEYWAKT
jgi:hypothetical protein